MIHTTHYTPQGLPLFPVPFPIGIGRKHLMADDMRQYAKAGRAERTKKESLSRAEQAQKRMEASEQKYKAALDGKQKTAKQLFGHVSYKIGGIEYKVTHKAIRGQLGMMVKRGVVKRIPGVNGFAFYEWIVK